MRTIFVPFLLLVFFLVQGCTPVNQKPFPDLPETELTGVITEWQGSLWFQPCQERLWWPLEDYTPTGELESLYKGQSSGTPLEIYTELSGAVDPEQQHSLLVSRVDLMGGGRSACQFDLSGLQFRAASSSPFWVADIAKEHTTVKSANPVGSYSFLTRASEQSLPDNGLLTQVYTEKNPSKSPFTLTLIPRRCIDPITGIVLPFTSEMNLYGQKYSGCARKGREQAEINTISGLYWYTDKGRQVLMRLGEDKIAQLVLQDRSGQAKTEKGRWQYLESGKLILSMKDRQGKEYLMLFRKQPEGTMKLQTPYQYLVPNGAVFNRWQRSGLAGGQLLDAHTIKRLKRDGPANGDGSKAEPEKLVVKTFDNETIVPARVDEPVVREIVVEE